MSSASSEDVATPDHVSADNTEPEQDLRSQDDSAEDQAKGLTMKENADDHEEELEYEVEQECYHNPEPAPELVNLIDADNVGNTVFSKHWIFTTLMNLLKLIESGDGGGEKNDEVGGGESVVGGGGVVDLDDSLEDDLCKLWDMSMNQEVVKFLKDYKAVDLLMGVITKSSAPRATEICVGILGNMACVEEVCEEISAKKQFIELALSLLEVADAPTLVEATRLIRVCVCNTDTAPLWLTSLKESTDVTNSIHFILQSSTNEDLLKNTVDMVSKIMEADEELCGRWSSPDLVVAVMEALKQTGSHRSQVLETFLHLLQLISTTETGVQALVSYAGEVSMQILAYLVHISSDDIVGLEGREGVIGSALSVLSVVLSAWDNYKHLLATDFQLLRCLLKILDVVYRRHQRLPQRIAESTRHRSNSMPLHINGEGYTGDRRNSFIASACDQNTSIHVDTSTATSDPSKSNPDHSIITQSVSLECIESSSKIDGQRKISDNSAKGDVTNLEQDLNQKDVEGHTSDSITIQQPATCGDAVNHGENSLQVSEVGTCSSAVGEGDGREKMDKEKEKVDEEKADEDKDVDEEERKYVEAIIETLFEVLRDILSQVIKALYELPLNETGEDMVESNEEHSDSERESSNNSTKPKVPMSLVYLDSMCDRTRLVYLMASVGRASSSHSSHSGASPSNSSHLVDMISEMADKYSLKRLSRIVKESVHNLS